MKKHLLLALALLASPLIAQETQTLHITSTHVATRDQEKTYRTSFDQNIITGTIGNRVYTMEQLAAFGAFHFQVGSDYAVVKVDDRRIKLRVTDKKGRESTESLNVVSVAEH
jgi:hypothetical protein